MTQKQQTKGSFHIRGIVSGLDRDNAYKEDDVKNGANAGKLYRTINFTVETSPNNKIYVQIYQQERETFYAYKSNGKGKKGTTKEFKASQKNKLPEGYEILGVAVGLEQDEKGQNIVQHLTDFDAAEYIWDNLNDGDSVMIRGEITHRTYINKNDEEVTSTTYAIKNIYHCKEDIDFESEKFEEMAAFEHQFVFVSSDVDKDEGVVHITGYSIGYKGKDFNPARFVVRPEKNDAIKKIANGFAVATEFGDVVKVSGKIVSRPVVVEVDEDETGASEVEDIFGSGVEVKGTRSAVAGYVRELQIMKVDEFTRAVYAPEDFVVEELVEEVGSDADGFPIDISDDDLPF